MRTHKTLLTLAAAAVAVLGLATISFAGITGTPHDFSSAANMDDAGDGAAMATASGNQICIACHTPHNANTAAGKLWNHEINLAQTYTLYGGTVSGAAGSAVDLDATSRLCLSCHDGVSANVDAFGGSSGTVKISSGFAVGTDLSNDHPVGDKATYSTYKVGSGATYTWADTRMKDLTGGVLRLKNTASNPALATPAAGAVVTGKGVVSCYTCHNPHGGAVGADKFLRVNNTGSALCLTCHNK